MHLPGAGLEGQPAPALVEIAPLAPHDDALDHSHGAGRRAELPESRDQLHEARDIGQRDLAATTGVHARAERGQGLGSRGAEFLGRIDGGSVTDRVALRYIVSNEEYSGREGGAQGLSKRRRGLVGMRGGVGGEYCLQT